MGSFQMLFTLLLGISVLNEVLGYGLDSPLIDVSPSFTNSGRDCFVTLTLLGQGVNDGIEGYCSEQRAEAIIKEEYFILGNPKKMSLCLYSEKRNTLVVINGKKCSFRTYQTSGGMTRIQSELIDDRDCEKIKDFMVKKLESAQRPNYNPPPSTQTPRSPSPYNSRSSFPSSADNWPNSGNSFSKSPSYKENPRETKTSSRPEAGKSVSSSPSFNSYPSETDTTTPIVRTEPVPQAAFQNYFSTSVSSQTFGNRGAGGSEVQIVVKGFGINDIFKEQSTKKFNPKVVKSDEVLTIMDPNNDQMAIYTNEESTLVVVRGGQCTKRRYTLDRKSTTITFDSVSKVECEDIKQEMASYHSSQSNAPDIWDHFNQAVEDQERRMFERQQLFLGRGRSGL